jgi:spore coat polysaccharide biosynthesis predicted glycosyltransferase SpsG
LSNNYDLIYYCDSYSSIGNGHLKRGIDVLNNLCTINQELRLAIMGKFSTNAKDFIKLFLNCDVEINNNGLSDILIIDTMFKPGDPDYINSDFCNKLKKQTKRLIMINSGMNLVIPESIDILIDHIPNAKVSGNYKCKKFIGFDYSPVSSEFVNNNLSEGKNLLFVIGGNDYNDGLIKLVANLNIICPQEDVDIIISTHYPSDLIDTLLSIAKFKLKIFQNVDSIVPFFKNAHSVVCTYGNTTYESLTYNLPTFTVSYEKFQYQYSNYLEKFGVAFNMGYLNYLSPKILNVVYDSSLRSRLVKKTNFFFKKPGILNISNLIINELKNV